jgi:hypothetical protein
MRFLTKEEVVDLLGKAGFSVMPNPHLDRIALVLEESVASRQNRVGGRPPPIISRLPHFVEALNRWLPLKMRRVLWVADWSSDVPSAYELFVAARSGLGEHRPLCEGPGICFDPPLYEGRDQVEMPPEQARETGLFIGLVSLIMINGWDGWFVADRSSDRVEFWEGNMFFYSSEAPRLAEAKSLMDQFDCPQDLI